MARHHDSEHEYRYERKFCTSELSYQEMENVLRHHPALFLEVYPARWVNNCYLDTAGMDSYEDNLSGVRDRVKARVRWYGELFGEIPRPVLELKVKQGMVGRKGRFPLEGFTLDGSFSRGTLDLVFRRSAMPVEVRMEMLCLGPVLINRYLRRYFESADRKYRLTLDRQLEYYAVRSLRNTFAERLMNAEGLVVELKYAPEDEEGAARICGCLPLTMSRNSKYASGVDRLYA